MSAFGFLLLAMFLWFTYNVVVKFVLPIYRTTKQIKKQFRNMAEQRQQHAPQADEPTIAKPQTKAGEYIEFEEVK